MGSSPLARGLRCSRPRRSTIRRIIPARAGFTKPSFLGRLFTTDHPRSRGVYRSFRRIPANAGGSSPLARGLPSHYGLKGKAEGIIPARAGFTWRCRTLSLRDGDHPRSRGVYFIVRLLSVVVSGSSPLARGLLSPSPGCERRHRIIPARAGFTERPLPFTRPYTDHPRSRGVYLPLCVLVVPPMGSSPLARGLPNRNFRPAPAQRIIPARAGFTF